MKLIFCMTEKNESLRGRELLDTLLADAGIYKYEIFVDDQGKPRVKDREDIDFNITHSRGFVACVLSVGEGRVGVDAEPDEGAVPKDRQSNFAKRFFSEKEKSAFEEGKRSFSEIWTRKEAYLKMLGTGIRANIKSTDTENLPNVSFSTYNLRGFTLTLASETQASVLIEET